MSFIDVVVGVDMGATHIRICVMDLNHQILLIKKDKTKQVITDNFIDGIAQFCQKFTQSKRIKHIVIGLPATISLDRKKVLSIPNLPILGTELDLLTSKLSKKFNCSVLLERDVNLQMTFDVHHFQLQDKLVLGTYLGTGIGFSIWCNGKLFIGANGVAGELGHIPYGDSQIQCSCGNYGCLETCCSGIILKNWFEDNHFDFPIEHIFKYECQNAFIQDYLNNIAKAISTTVNLFDPNYLVLGGGIIDMPYFPLEQLKLMIGQYVRKPL
ncbi:TPA: allose kinase, partial [Pasteurella multocida]|nr:allose kinase [Pasteurella multocida]